VGTTAIIVGVSYLEDGRYDLVTVGDERFRLRDVRHDEPYLVGSAEPWPFEDSIPGLEERLAPAVRARFDRYLALLASAQGHQINIESIPDDPRGLAMLVAVAVQVSMPDKQRLLCQASIADLLRAEHRLLRREEMLLDYVSRTQADQQGMGYSGMLAAN
jgi:Lon protease-like protein